MSATYSALLAQIQSYLERNDPATIDQIPSFVSLGQQRLSRESKNIGFEQYVTSTFIVGTCVYAKPNRWRRNITLNVGSGPNNNTQNIIQLRSYEYIQKYWPDRTATGLPKFYCDYGYNNILVAPTPDQPYPFEWGYLELVQPLSLANQQNWLTLNVPDILLYASLLESAPFLKDDERVATWKDFYNTALQSLNGQDSIRTTDRSSNRDSD